MRLALPAADLVGDNDLRGQLSIASIEIELMVTGSSITLGDKDDTHLGIFWRWF